MKQKEPLKPVDLIIAAGGWYDEVVNGAGTSADTFIPTATRALKTPMGDPVAAAALLKNQTIQMDIGRAYGSKYFINIAAAGTMTE